MKKNKQPEGSNAIPAPFSAYPRCAGVLLHITSLPSDFGIGDVGETAYQFVRFLQKSKQTIWQVLPINSTSPEQGFSPYGSNGSFAGNVLLISPELLVKDGLLSENDCLQSKIKTTVVDYKKAQEIKTILLDKAYANFIKNKQKFESSFIAFCNDEKHWLDDYALYVVLKDEHRQKSWNEWSNEYKYRDKKSLKSFAGKHPGKIENIKWQQFIFHKQWFDLKDYCKDLGIQIFGDLPFYVAYDSADVWANQHLFKLDKNGKMIAEGGAPPDDFNEQGQRWGMPVYNWDAIKNDKYKWWLKRMKKNIALFDLLRLDHFRGFSAYWEIKTNAESAKDGKWKPVPGAAFFTLLQKQTGSLPLVAEDLGSIDEPVIQLRNKFAIPGMIIQQLAFGEDMPQSNAIPHHHYKNAVVYTGNHDNNTTLGWFQSLTGKIIKRISTYTKQEVTESNIVDVMIRLVYASVAQVAILPMQDILELDEHARMNGLPDGDASWGWKMNNNWQTKKIEKKLQDVCFLYDREAKAEQ